ncbi:MULTISPECIES: hypothetical protein [Rhodospirillales]|uniref:Uncharacterized protein n=2 Tax=Rhodospirillales TaxID=204441 RepID=B6IWR6_RHOCS|nr:hypothetical protein [Rhodospirillum centenum]ACJ00740.1 hypothetical protein RC1_3380 [Rhodospirillum centenum SW]
MTESQWMSLVYALALLVLLVPAFLRLRMPGQVLLRNIALWLAAFAALGLIYSLFGPF